MLHLHGYGASCLAMLDANHDLLRLRKAARAELVAKALPLPAGDLVAWIFLKS